MRFYNPFLKAILLLVAVLGFVQEAAAQRNARQKIGLVDSDYLLNQLPEYKGLDQTLNQMTIQWEQEIQDEQKKLDELLTDFRAKEILFTDEVRKQKLTEIESLEKKIGQLRNQRFGPQGDYFKEQQRLLEPIQRKVWEAIETVASREDFDIIFDRSGEVLVMYARAEWDISKLVLEELGIDTEDLGN
jgi:outer membrane protein